MHKLIVVDDEKETREALCDYFPWDELGFTIIGQFDNAKQALGFLKENTVDVVLCDIQMSVMTGIELAQHLFETRHSCKVIFLSGYREFEYAQKAVEYGVKHYIVKPAKYKELVKVFGKLRTDLEEEQHVALTTSVMEDASDTPKEMDYNEKIISMVKEYVQKYYKEATLENAARIVNMNPNYLSQFFKQKTGSYFSDYLVSVKMQTAAQLLSDIRYKTYEVSEMVGYSNPKNFTRSFKQYYGINPKSYRYNK